MKVIQQLEETERSIAMRNAQVGDVFRVYNHDDIEPIYIMACYKNSLGQKKMKLFNIQIFNRGRLDILALQQFITPDHCLKCGRKLNDEDEKS